MPCKTAYVSNCKYNYIKRRCENCYQTNDVKHLLF